MILLLVGCNFPLEDEGTLKRKTATVRISYHGLKFHDIDLNVFTNLVCFNYETSFFYLFFYAGFGLV